MGEVVATVPPGMQGERSFLALDTALARCAGEPAERLDALAAVWPAGAALLTHLVVFAEGADPDAQRAAVKLLARYLEGGARLPPAAAARFLDGLPELARWETRLQALQALPHIAVPLRQAEVLHGFLQRCLAGPNKFLRAWAYSGLHGLASQHGGYRERVIPLLERAGREEAPSVRARLRRLPPLT